MSLRRLSGEVARGVAELVRPYFDQVKNVVNVVGPSGAMLWVMGRPPMGLLRGLIQFVNNLADKYGLPRAYDTVIPIANVDEKIFALSYNVYSEDGALFNIFIVMPMKKMDDASIDVFVHDRGSGMSYRHTVGPYRGVSFEQSVPIGEVSQHLADYLRNAMSLRKRGGDSSRKNTRRRRKT
ncbi:MAG: hypothetical protein ACK4SY_07105 [Pyrobaculum sp.]